MSRKIGFWAVLALVIGSQIGSGVFMLPASLAPFGAYSLLAWGIAGLGAIALAFVFAQLCARFPQTGGPHVYVNQVFGPSFAFFTGWTYWVISWVSTTAVIVASIGYLSPFVGHHHPTVYLALEILLVMAITALNLKGVKAAGRAEFVLTLIKFIPLFVMPIVALKFFKLEHLVLDAQMSSMTFSEIAAKATLLTLWGFIGLESATTPAGSIENPSRTIPRAVVWGTFLVAVLYFINSIGIMGLIPGHQLAASKAPYVDAARMVFGGNWHFVISLMASVVCIGTLNAWMLSSGQIALGLAQDGLFPKFFGQKNSNEAPICGLIISFIGIVPLLVMTSNENLSAQITSVIDFSVTAFLFVYLMCGIAYLTLLIRSKEKRVYQYVLGLIAIAFCSWVLYETSFKTLFVASLFTLSGLPVFIFRKIMQSKS